MAYTIEDLQQVQAAIKSSALTVRMGDRLITYRSQKDLEALEARIQAELGVSVPANRRGRAWKPVTSSGL